MSLTKSESPLQLTWSQKDRKVVLSAEDNDRFVLTVEEAIAACRVYDPSGRARLQTQFKRLLDLLGEWVGDHSEKIEKAFLTVRDRGLLFLVMMNQVQYDPALEDDLTELDLQIANEPDFQDFSVSVLALPECGADAYLSFINPQLSLEYKDRDAK